MSTHLGIYLTAYDQASKTITAVAGQVDTLGQQTGKAGKEVEDTGKSFINFNRVLETATGLILRDVIRGFTQATVEAFTLGAQIGTLRASFDALQKQAGATELSLEGLRRATQGMVSDVDLLQAANKAMSMHLPIENLDRFFDAAIRVGKSMGLTATQAIDDFTVAIGRQQPKILDNFGIILQQTDAYDEYARSLGKTADALTDSERETAFATVAIRKLMDQARILGDNISETEIAQERWNASIENAKTGVGEFLGPLGAIAPILQGVMPLVGSLAASLIPSLIHQVGGATAVIHGLNVAVKALMGPIGWAILGISALAAALATDFLGIRTALENLTKDYQTRFNEQTKAVQDAYRDQLAAIEDMVTEAEDKYRGLEDALEVSYTAQVTAAQQAWLDLVAVTTSGWDDIVKQYDAYYDRQLVDLNRFYDERLDVERAYLDAVQGARSKDLDALELQFLKERQAIEASDQPYANKRIFIERLEKRYNRERAQLSEDYRVQELTAEQQFNEAQAAIEGERADAVQRLEEQRVADAAAIREDERAIETQHAQDLAALEQQKQDELADISARAYQLRLDAERQFNEEMLVLRAQMYEEMQRMAGAYGYAGPAGAIEEEGRPPVIPVVPGARGVEATVQTPTLFLAGERGRERVSITPERGQGGYVMSTPTRVQMVFNAPILYVEGSADRSVLEQSTINIQQVLQNITIEPTSPGAPATQRRIRLGTTLTSPTTVKSSTSTTGGTTGGGLGGGGGGKPWKWY